ncbi:MAG: hypothetical protein VXB01_15900, partial [Opitutae bacterium]
MHLVFLLTVHVFVPLLLGTWIYVAWRSPTLLVFDWLDALNIDPAPIRANIDIPYFVEYCLPNGFWVYAGTSCMLLLWKRPTLWAFTYVVLGALMEVGQLVKVVPGTFELLDLLACFLGFAVSYRMVNRCLVKISAR